MHRVRCCWRFFNTFRQSFLQKDQRVSAEHTFKHNSQRLETRDAKVVEYWAYTGCGILEYVALEVLLSKALFFDSNGFIDDDRNVGLLLCS